MGKLAWTKPSAAPVVGAHLSSWRSGGISWKDSRHKKWGSLGGSQIVIHFSYLTGIHSQKTNKVADFWGGRISFQHFPVWFPGMRDWGWNYTLEFDSSFPINFGKFWFEIGHDGDVASHTMVLHFKGMSFLAGKSLMNHGNTGSFLERRDCHITGGYQKSQSKKP